MRGDHILSNQIFLIEVMPPWYGDYRCGKFTTSGQTHTRGLRQPARIHAHWAKTHRAYLFELPTDFRGKTQPRTHGDCQALRDKIVPDRTRPHAHGLTSVGKKSAQREVSLPPTYARDYRSRKFTHTGQRHSAEIGGKSPMHLK